MPVPTKTTKATKKKVTKKKVTKKKTTKKATKKKSKVGEVIETKDLKKKKVKTPKNADRIERASSERDIIYETYSVELFFSDSNPRCPKGPNGENLSSGPMTEDKARELIGWREPEDDQEFEESDYLFIHPDTGKTIACDNNNQNRPFSLSLSLQWSGTFAMKEWEVNGESMIIGETGMTLDCQHRLIGFIIFCERYREDPTQFLEWWEDGEEPTFECYIFLGVEEAKNVINTINVGKTRSLSDAIYAIGIFEEVSKSRMRYLSKVLEYAIRIVWERTGANSVNLSPKRTHAQALTFLDNHPHIIDFVFYADELYEEFIDMSNLIHAGYAAGLMYLMASSTTDTKAYRKKTIRNENSVDFSREEKAKKFWKGLGASEKLSTVHDVIKRLSMDEDGPGGSHAERLAVIIKAWLAYKSNKAITTKLIKPKYTEIEGMKVLTEFPEIGGLDLDLGDDEL